MRKPKIFIAMHYMELGGAETALVGLLNAFDPERVDVDLFLHDHRGDMMRFIPKWVNLLPAIPEYTVLERPIVELVRRGFLGIAAARLWAKHLSKKAYQKGGSKLENVGGFDKMSMCTTPMLPPINPSVTYDLAISFLTPHRIVTDKVKAQKKIAWIHTDYTRVWVDAAEELKVWEKYDYIASISSDVTKTFIKTFPTLASKIVEIENIMPKVLIESRAEEFDVDWDKEGHTALATAPTQVGGGKCLRILSIGRFSEQKNFDNLPFICTKLIEEMKRLLSIGRFCEAKNYDNVPDICKRIIESGCDIKWYIIGYGSDEPLIRQKIAEAGMQEHVIILGKKENPYPYIKACDIYVQPSRYEGKSITVREAQMLCKPIAVTNYPTANSQIQDGVDGVIVPMDNEGCAKGLAEFILNEQKQQQVTAYLRLHDYTGMSEVEKIYKMIE